MSNMAALQLVESRSVCLSVIPLELNELIRLVRLFLYSAQCVLFTVRCA